MFAPLALIIMGAGAVGSQSVINDRTYAPEGIYEKPEIYGIDARWVMGGLGLLGSAILPGVLGLAAAGAAVGAATAMQTANKVSEVYQMASLEFDNRALAAQHGEQLAPPVQGFEVQEHWQAAGYGGYERTPQGANNPRNYLQGLMSA